MSFAIIIFLYLLVLMAVWLGVMLVQMVCYWVVVRLALHLLYSYCLFAHRLH